MTELCNILPPEHQPNSSMFLENMNNLYIPSYSSLQKLLKRVTRFHSWYIWRQYFTNLIYGDSDFDNLSSNLYYVCSVIVTPDITR